MLSSRLRRDSSGNPTTLSLIDEGWWLCVLSFRRVCLPLHLDSLMQGLIGFRLKYTLFYDFTAGG
jgi:hypothetical protein